MTKSDAFFTFNQGNPSLHLWFRQAKKCLVKNEKAKQIGQKMQITYRQPKHLKKLVTGLPRKDETKPGCFKCVKNCHSCKILKEGKYLYSKNTGKRYTIKESVSCESNFVIYLGTCLRCLGGDIWTQTGYKEYNIGVWSPLWGA
jgi:hypothetical protein